MFKFTYAAVGMIAFCCGSAFAAPADEIISEQPEGVVNWFSEECDAYYASSWGFATHEMNDGFAKKVVFSEDGKTVWFRNPISMFPTNTWVKGTVDGETITLPLNQVISVNPGKDGGEDVWTIGAMQGERVYDEEWDRWTTEWTKPDLESITYTYKDGMISQNEEGIMLSLFCNDSYMVYGDLNAKMIKVNPDEDIVRFPENAEIQKWTMSYGKSIKDGYPVDVAVVDDEVYIRGFWEKEPNATIKGKVEDGVLTIPSQQYLGYTTKSGVDFFIYFMTCEKGTPSIMQYYQPLTEPLVFDIDSETGTVTQPATNPDEALRIMVKGGKFTDFELNKGVAFLVLDNPNFKIDDNVLGNPQAPYLDPNFCFRVYTGCSQLEFTILPFDEEGDALSKSNIKYCAWVDGEKVLFDADEFENWEKIPEPTYELPFDFSNNWGVWYDTDNMCIHSVQIPNLDPEKFGVQVIYYDPATGDRKESLIAYYYPATKEIKYEEGVQTGVEEMEFTDAVSVEYFDLLGGRVAENFKGLCVKVMTFADGFVKSVKVIR